MRIASTARARRSAAGTAASFPGLLCLAAGVLLAPGRGDAQGYAFVNGNWFNGRDFEPRTVYVTEGVFSGSPPARIDSTFDLHNGYVIPPFGEAHNHNLDTDYMLADRIDQYLRDGVFYAKMQSSIKARIDRNRHLFNHSSTVDVAFAHAPLTAAGGHPVKLREDFFDQGRFAGLFASKAEIEGAGYVIVDSERDLEEKWDRILAARPDFIKANLLFSEEFAERRDDPAYFGQKGLDPRLLPAIVRKAHGSGLRVSVHVETATDFHHAVAAGVDEVNHLPGRDAESMEPIRDADALSAAGKKIVVVTTAGLMTRTLDPGDSLYAAVRGVLAENLRILNSRGVALAVGSDMYNDTSLDEAMFLAELGVFTPLELLKMWVENSPRTIFPERKIGRLAEGFEASFLVLAGNPLEEFEQVTDITMRWKQGVHLSGIDEEEEDR